MIATLVGYGFTSDEAAAPTPRSPPHVIGFTIQEHAPGAIGPQESGALGDYYRGLDPDRYPNTVSAARALTEVSSDDELLEGLDHLLDGIGKARGPVGSTPAPPSPSTSNVSKRACLLPPSGIPEPAFPDGLAASSRVAMSRVPARATSWPSSTSARVSR